MNRKCFICGVILTKVSIYHRTKRVNITEQRVNMTKQRDRKIVLAYGIFM